MRKQTRERVPLWQTPPAKPVFWKKTLSPFLFVLIGLAIWFVLRTVPISSGLKYIGGSLTLVAAIVTFALKSHSEYKKTGQFSPTSAEVIGTSVAVAIALMAICGTWADDKDKSEHSAREAKDKKQQQQFSETQRAREAAIAYGEKTLALQAEHNKREEIANARTHALDIKLQERVTQELTREEAARSRQEQREATNNLRSVAIENHISEAAVVLKGFGDTEKGISRTAGGLQATATAINRSVNHIESVQLTYQVLLPLSRPEMASYRSKLLEVLQQFMQARARGVDGKADTQGLRLVGNSYTGAGGDKLSSERIEILPTSPVYPSNFDNSFSNLLSYPVRVKITRRRKKLTDIEHPAYSDMTLETRAGSSPKLFLFLTNGELVLAFTGIPALIGKNDADLWAVPDLDDSKVEVHRNTYNYDTGDFVDKSLTDLQKHCAIVKITYNINNQGFAFDGQDLGIVNL